MTRFFTLVICLFALTGLVAQQLYTVQVGTFIDVRNADFNEIKPLGFVYGNTMEGNLTQVFLGNYADFNKAETVAGQLRTRGFKNAMVLQRPTDTGQNVVVIQLATQTYGKPINWEEMERAGDLFVENDDQLIKIMTGVYPDVATAQIALPEIQQLGYRDAFVKTINNGRLIPIGTFETGIKKALIPIALNNAPPVAPMPNQVPQGQGSPTTYSPQVIGANNTPATDPNNTPATYGTTRVVAKNPATDVVNNTGVATGMDLPEIRGRMKRESAVQLQTVLKEKGYYSGLLDGYYGAGTSAAYQQAWTSMPAMSKYQLMSAATVAEPNDLVAKWPETKVLLTIAEDLSAGMSDRDLAAQSIVTRLGLYQSRQPLSTAAATRASAWELTLLENLNAWATEDPLHAQIMSAFRITYFQTKVRLEDYYMNLGHSSESAKSMSVATLQALIGADLERFL